MSGFAAIAWRRSSAGRERTDYDTIPSIPISASEMPKSPRMLHSADGFMTTMWCPTRKPQQQYWRKYLAEEFARLLMHKIRLARAVAAIPNLTNQNNSFPLDGRGYFIIPLLE